MDLKHMENLKHVKHFKHVTIAVVILIIVLLIASLFIYNSIKKEVGCISSNQLQTTQFLLANMDYKTERQRLVLFSRDKILQIRKDISYDEAFTIANTNVKYSEVYPKIDPLYILAIQTVESRFHTDAVSSMGAVGLCQVMPINARHISKGYGICYDDSMLYDIEYNVRLAAEILDDALASYKKYDVALAYYNGGGFSAYYYMTKNAALSEETTNYVPTVMNIWNNLKSDYKTYRLNVNSLIDSSFFKGVGSVKTGTNK